MRQLYKDISIEKLINTVNQSDSLVEVTKKLGLDPYFGNTKKNIERLIKRNNISIEHFSTVKRVRDFTVRYNKDKLIELVNKSTTLKEILLELDILPIESNYKTLKKYLQKYNINYLHISSNKNRKAHTYANYDETNLKKIISESLTFQEVFIKLGLSIHGNYNTLHNYINKYNIDISHFKANEIIIRKLQAFNTIPIENILIENSKYVSTNTLKKRLYKEGLKEHKCELCGQDEIWQGKHMSLILDHIDGVPNNNKIENLQIVCPNCNATLSTFAGKNVKKNRAVIHYCKCGNKMNKTSILCNTCEKINRRKVERPPYEQLQNEIKEDGYSATGRKYGVSDKTIKKWIKFYEKECLLLIN
jgi:hypothetical protein